MEERTLEIRGMHCDHCVATVRRELARIPGLTVREVRIGSATLRFDPAVVSGSRISEAIRRAGFAPADE